MIAPMLKCALLVLDSTKKESLSALRALGAVHLELKTGASLGSEDTKGRLEALDRALSLAREFEKKKASEETPLLSPSEAEAKASLLNEADARIRALRDELGRLKGDAEKLESWGDFDPLAIKDLEASGLLLSLHDIEAKREKELRIPEGFLRIDLESPKGRARFALARRPGEILPEELQPASLPARSLSAVKAAVAEKSERISTARAELEALAAFAPSYERARKLALARLAFESAHDSMENDGPIAWIMGWIPAKREAELSTLAAAQGWALSLEDPEDADQPPTQVTNPAVVRIIQPIFDFLGTMPGYREYEISVWFLLFFSVFFAMIFGDAGYGSLLLLVGIVGALRAKARKGPVPDAVRLLLLLSCMTVAWGAVTVSWFGIDPRYLPEFLKVLAIPAIASTNPDPKAAGDNVKLFCFILGAVQLSIAHIKNLIRDRKSPKVFAQIGFLLEVFGLFWLVLYLVISPERFPLPNYSVYCLGIGFALVFVFGNWTGKLGSSILESLKNIISVFLGTVSVMADIVSYIRLWAVGLAGVAISQTVNGMGSGLFGGAVWLRILMAFTAVPLLFGLGHGLNMVMSVLSVVVHGVRLNLLEFSGHLGMEWSGYKYEPFRVSAEEES